MAAAQPVRPQYTPEQRNFLFVEHVKNKGKRRVLNTVISTGFKIDFQEKFKIINDFVAKYPGVRPPSKTAIEYIQKKQMLHHTCHNLNSKTSPGDSQSGRRKTSRTAANIDIVRQILEDDAAKPRDDDTVRLVSLVK